MRRRTLTEVFVVLALGVAALAFLAVFTEHRTSADLRIYYRAVNFWLDGHGDVYDFQNPRTLLGFTYPPFAALVMVPVAVLPWTGARLVVKAASIAVALLVVYWFVDPAARRHGWTRWFTWAVAGILAVVFEPLRETVSFGQVNMVLVGLVVADFALLIGRGSRFGGLGIGLATAIKLTPGIFIGYLLIARRWRAAAVAIVTAVAANLLAVPAAPHASLTFWTRLVWDTNRVGSPIFISNQALSGFVARLDRDHFNSALWLVLVACVVVAWGWRVRYAVATGDHRAGVALTAVAGCLVSPITWVHHLVWLMPVLLLLADRGLAARGPRRRILLGLAGTLYVLLSSRLIWQFTEARAGLPMLLGDAYLYATVVLMIALPIEPRAVAALAPAPAFDPAPHPAVVPSPDLAAHPVPAARLQPEHATS